MDFVRWGGGGVGGSGIKITLYCRQKECLILCFEQVSISTILR